MKLHCVYPFFASLLLLASACQSRDEKPVSVSGTVTGAEGQKLFLEYLGIDGVTLQDSLTLKADGAFDFEASAPEYPDFFRLRLGREAIPFVADSLDQIRITADASADGSFGSGYTLEGEPLNDKIREVRTLYAKASREVASLLKQYSDGKLSIFDFGTLRETKLQEYKKAVETLIYDNPSSPAAYYGLMQQIDGQYIFNPNDAKDSRLFATVANVRQAADSLSLRTKHLYDLALRSIASIRSLRKQAEAASDTTSVAAPAVTPEVVGIIDIKLPDASGAQKALSSVTAQGVTLLSFTAMSAPWAPEFNNLLSTLYAKYHGRGLNLYQVNMDTDGHIWRNVIKDQPWVNVLDPAGNSSEYIGYYGLTNLPALFLIDKKGDIVLRASSVEELEKGISAELAR